MDSTPEVIPIDKVRAIPARISGAFGVGPMVISLPLEKPDMDKLEPAQPSAEQQKEWEASRFHENDGSYRGDFGGPADAPSLAEPAKVEELPAEDKPAKDKRK